MRSDIARVEGGTVVHRHPILVLADALFDSSKAVVVSGRNWIQFK
jgi:hypothetical protein